MSHGGQMGVLKERGKKQGDLKGGNWEGVSSKQTETLNQEPRGSRFSSAKEEAMVLGCQAVLRRGRKQQKQQRWRWRWRWRRREGKEAGQRRKGCQRENWPRKSQMEKKKQKNQSQTKQGQMRERGLEMGKEQAMATEDRRARQV